MFSTYPHPRREFVGLVVHHERANAPQITGAAAIVTTPGTKTCKSAGAQNQRQKVNGENPTKNGMLQISYETLLAATEGKTGTRPQRHGAASGTKKTAKRRARNLQRKQNVTAILKGMIAHQDQTGDEIEQGCKALIDLTSKDVNADNTVEITQQGGIDIILKGMLAHQGHAGVQAHGCGALMNLGVNADNMVEIAKQGGATAILKGMIAHQGHARLQECGCGALVIIGWSQRDVQERMKGEGAVEVLKRHCPMFPKQRKERIQQLLLYLLLLLFTFYLF